jgi:hypothetical protein
MRRFDVAGRPTARIITVQNMATKVDNLILYGLQPTIVDVNGPIRTSISRTGFAAAIPPRPEFPTTAGSRQRAGAPSARQTRRDSGSANHRVHRHDNNDTFSAGDATTVNTDGFLAAISFVNNP